MLSKTAFNRMKKAELVEWALETQRTAGEAALFAEEDVEEEESEKPTAYHSDAGRALCEVREYLERFDHDEVKCFDQIMERECPAWLNAFKTDQADSPAIRYKKSYDEPPGPLARAAAAAAAGAASRRRCRAFLSELETLHDSVVKENKELKEENDQLKEELEKRLGLLD